MTVQIIITGNDVADVRNTMAGLLGTVKLALSELPATIEPEAGNGAAGGETHEPPKKNRAGRKPKAEPEPEKEVETQAETAAADDADEVEDAATEATADDVRAALTEFYLERYGRDATQADILKLYKMRFPDGSVSKVSDIPEGMHGQVITDIKEMATKNPFKRKAL